MHTRLDIPAGTLVLDLPDREATRAFFAEALAQQAFLVTLAERPPDFATLRVTVKDPGFELAFPATVVQVFPQGEGHGVAFQLAEWDDARRAELERRLAVQPRDEGELFGTAPVYRIQQLDLPQKMQLALKADRGERQILCRDTAPMVLQNLLANPRLEAENVLALVKSNFCTAEILQRVAADRRWMASAEIRTAVVRNPKTPTPLAVRLLETLPLGELRDLAKMGSAKEELRQAAFKVFTRLSSRR